MKGKKFASTFAHENRPRDARDPAKRQLWHTIDKYPEELTCQNRATHAKDLLKTAISKKWQILSEPELMQMIDASRDMGSAVLLRKFLPADVFPRNPLKIPMRNFPTYNLKVMPEAQE
eukprot:2407110-Pyramimonas_sp.AAC.1